MERRHSGNGAAHEIAVTGWHGGILGGKPETAIKHDVAAVVCNDAGVGRDAPNKVGFPDRLLTGRIAKGSDDEPFAVTRSAIE